MSFKNHLVTYLLAHLITFLLTTVEYGRAVEKTISVKVFVQCFFSISHFFDKYAWYKFFTEVL